MTAAVLLNSPLAWYREKHLAATLAAAPGGTRVRGAAAARCNAPTKPSANSKLAKALRRKPPLPQVLADRGIRGLLWITSGPAASVFAPGALAKRVEVRGRNVPKRYLRTRCGIATSRPAAYRDARGRKRTRQQRVVLGDVVVAASRKRPWSSLKQADHQIGAADLGKWQAAYPAPVCWSFDDAHPYAEEVELPFTDRDLFVQLCDQYTGVPPGD